MQSPLYNHLIEYHSKNRISFAMPGHKNGRGLPADIINCDVTELEMTADLHHQSHIVKKSCQMISEIYQSEKSYILTGGSTAGIQAVLVACLNPGDVLLSSPDCHRSVINACALLGIKLMLAPMKYDNFGHCREFDTDKLDEIIKENNIKAVMAVSPDYYGICKRLGDTYEICKNNNIPLLIDNAHGAHFAVSDIFPRVIGDAVVMSAHKTLNSMNGGAFLHIYNSTYINTDRLERALTMLQSSSPSYVIAASAEFAAVSMSREEWELTAKRCKELKKRVPLLSLNNDDPTRLVFFTGDKSGAETEKILAEKFEIDIEMADCNSIVLIATPSNTEADFERLYEALCTFKNNTVPKTAASVKAVEGVFLPSSGFYCEIEMVSLKNSQGRIAACVVTAYPPGVPIICIGAVITEDMIDTIVKLQNSGVKISGIENELIRVVI